MTHVGKHAGKRESYFTFGTIANSSNHSVNQCGEFKKKPKIILIL